MNNLKTALDQARNEALKLYKKRDSDRDSHVSYVKAYAKYNQLLMALFIEDAEK